MGFLKLLFRALGGASAPAPKPRSRVRPAEAAFRRDPVHDKVFFDAPRPEGVWRQATASHVGLVGEFFRLDNYPPFMAGADRKLELRREPDSPHDPNAMAVDGVWAGPGGEARAHLGYLPRELAAEIAATRPADMPLLAVPISLFLGRNTVDLKVCLYEPGARADYWKARGEAAPKVLAGDW